MAEFSSKGVALALGVVAGAVGYADRAEAADWRTFRVPVDGKHCRVSVNLDNYKPSITRRFTDCCDVSDAQFHVRFNNGHVGQILARGNGPQCRASSGGGESRDPDIGGGKTDPGLGDQGGDGGTTTLGFNDTVTGKIKATQLAEAKPDSVFVTFDARLG